MAHSKSAEKRIRQNATRQARNRWRKRTMRSAIKDFEDKLLHADGDAVRASFRAACQVIDRTAQRGVIHKNMAARKKSRMSTAMKKREIGLV